MISSEANYEFPVLRIRVKQGTQGTQGLRRDAEAMGEPMELFLRRLADYLQDNLNLCGVEGVIKCILTQGHGGPWCLWTKGTVAGLRNVMNVEGVDWRRTKSNHIAEVFRVSAWRRGMLT